MARKFKQYINPFIKVKETSSSLSCSEIPKLQEAIEFHQLGQLDKAQTIYKHLIAIDSNNSAALHLLGVIACQKGRYQVAFELITQAIAINSQNAVYHSNLGIALNGLNKFGTALASFDRAIEIDSLYAEAYSNRGITLKALKQLYAAVSCYDKAIFIAPTYFQAYFNRGNALKELKQLDAAIASYDKAISLNPNYFEAYANRGNALKELKKIEAAVQSYQNAISLNPSYAEAHFNLGISLEELKHFDEAVKCYDKALYLKPNYEYFLGIRLHAKMSNCNWHDFLYEISELRDKIRSGFRVLECFPALALPLTLHEQRQVAETWIKDKHPFDPSLGPIPKSARHSKIRIGYYSADFRNHPVSILSAGLFEHHDKSKFEVIGFSFGPDVKDEMHERLIKSFDQFIDVRSMSDAQVASLSRSLEVDIAVDLGGHTLDSRTGIFAYRAAPIQLSYIGYLGTMGAHYYDYLIADRTIIPAKSQGFYSEKIVYLPSYQVNDNKQEIPRTALSRQELNLPSSGFVYCCFNANYKITPFTFDGWMRILKAVPDSVLLLYTDIPSAAKNLKIEAQKRGVDPERLIFGEKLIRAKYLARCRAADLFLDTLPYNAGATASDALWAGLPVLTCMGESFASRYAASLLNAIGLPELVTQTQAEYEALAIELANDPAKLQEIKDKLERNRLTTPLFDTAGFTKNIEAAYTQMYERCQADLQPEHIYSNA